MDAMSSAGAQPSAGRVSACAAVLLAGAVVVDLLLGHQAPDGPSFSAGYRAAADGPLIRAVMTRPGVTPIAVCNAIADRTFDVHAASEVNRQDFVNGCRSAVSDAME
jgi:hypothetical protein